MKRARRISVFSLIASPLVLPSRLLSAATQDEYPVKAMRIIVPYSAGGFNDVLARLLGHKLEEAWGKPVVIDNKPGGGTVVGTVAGLNAEPDGYTLTKAGFSTVVNQYLYKRIPYRTDTDISPVIIACSGPNVLLVHADSPYRSMGDLVAALKAKPNKLNYASAGAGTSLHLAMEYFKSVTGTEITHVPYKGSADIITALLGKQIEIMFYNLPSALPFLNAGKTRALAITSATRSPSLPDVPTVAEQGYAGFEVSPWYGFMAPKGTPLQIREKLNAKVNDILLMTDVRKVLAEQGVSVIGGSVEDFTKHFAAESARWEPVIRKARISLD